MRLTTAATAAAATGAVLAGGAYAVLGLLAGLDEPQRWDEDAWAGPWTGACAGPCTAAGTVTARRAAADLLGSGATALVAPAPEVRVVGQRTPPRSRVLVAAR